MNVLKPYTSQLLSVLRIMSGLLLLQHGTTKYLSIPAGPMNNINPMTMSGVAGLLELIGGVLLVIGLFTRPAAFIMSGLCAVAYFYAHAPRGFFPILNGGELAALYAFVFLPLGKKSALEHIRAILGTPAAQQAAAEVKGGVTRLVRKLESEARKSTGKGERRLEELDGEHDVDVDAPEQPVRAVDVRGDERADSRGGSDENKGADAPRALPRPKLRALSSEKPARDGL